MESNPQTTDRNTELLEQILSAEKKQLKLSRIRFGISMFGAVLALAAFLALLVGFSYVKRQVASVSQTLQDSAQSIQTITDRLKLVDFETLEETYKTFAEAGTKTILELEDGLGNLKDVMENAESALKGLNSVNIDSLNKGIERLNEVLAPLANFFSKIGR